MEALLILAFAYSTWHSPSVTSDKLFASKLAVSNSKRKNTGPGTQKTSLIHTTKDRAAGE
ncbi:hypothetical protein G9A89_021901 [Geosiphon pyriformis]|nr:hypothetical protein G9A89_021901 [Geosiphon pyriformis]